MFDTAKIIRKRFPTVDVSAIKWKRLSSSAKDRYYSGGCPFSWFLKYIVGADTLQNDIAAAGSRTHGMKDEYYKGLDAAALVQDCARVSYDKEECAKIIFNGNFSHLAVKIEKDAMKGFAKFEADRIYALFELFGDDRTEIARNYAPVASELDIRVGVYHGIIDCVFRDPWVGKGKYLILDWKDGLRLPGDSVPDKILFQVHYYGILLDLFHFYDGKIRVVPGRWAVVFPRFSMVYGDCFDESVKKHVMNVIKCSIENINIGYFPMMADEKHCRWFSKYPCDVFFSACKIILEEELGFDFGDLTPGSNHEDMIDEWFPA